jgi:transposase
MGGTRWRAAERVGNVARDPAPGLDLQKKTLAASEQDARSRAAFRLAIAALGAERIVAVDETATTIALTRRYARAPRAERAAGRVPKNYGTATTVVASLSQDGFGPAVTLNGALTTAAFQVYVRDILGPSLRPGQIVVLDNLAAHKAADITATIHARGCEVLFLPPYSPDFNPIELAFAKFKAVLRRLAPRTQPALDQALTTAIDCIPPAEAAGFIHHCGFRLAAPS